MTPSDHHGRRPAKRTDAQITGPDGLRRAFTTKALRDAGDEGLLIPDLAEALGSEAEVERIVAQLRARGHVIQKSQRADGARVTLHTP